MGACRSNLVDSGHLEPRHQRAQRHAKWRDARDSSHWKTREREEVMAKLTLWGGPDDAHRRCALFAAAPHPNPFPIVRRAQREEERARLLGQALKSAAGQRLPSRRRCSTSGVLHIAADLLQCPSRQTRARNRHSTAFRAAKAQASRRSVGKELLICSPGTQLLTNRKRGIVCYVSHATSECE